MMVIYLKDTLIIYSGIEEYTNFKVLFSFYLIICLNNGLNHLKLKFVQL